MARSTQPDDELLRSAFEALPHQVAIIDRDHRVVFLNRVARMAFAGGEKPRRRPCYRLFHGAETPCDPASRECPLVAVAATKEPFVARQERPGQDGHQSVLEISAVPLLDETGELAGILETIRDITDQARAEVNLADAERRFRTLFDCAEDYVFVVDPFDDKGPTIVDANEAAAAAHGYTLGDLIGLPLTLLDGPSSDLDLRTRAERVLTGVPQRFESQHTRKDGSTFDVEVSARLVQFGGRPLIFAIERDISGRKEAQEAILRASRLEATSTLAGGVAHDFNNLMVGVLGSAGLLVRKLRDRPDTTELLATIEEAGTRASALSQQLLAFARGGKSAFEVTDLAAIIVETLRLQEHATPPQIEIRREVEPGLWSVLAARGQLSQVLMNLCINATEAIASSGTITVSANNIELDESGRRPAGLEPGRYVRLTVTDTGSGMDEATRARIFEPSFSTKAQGRGLGLAVVTSIIRDHKGHISVAAAEGGGTRFEILLPAVDGAPRVSDRAGSALPTGDETVLIIDDEQIVVSVMKEVLRSHGYRVLVATDGPSAIAMARGFVGDIHLALLDLGMPLLSGEEVYAALAELRPEMKVVVCSGYEASDSAQPLLEAGASSFLHKPFEVAELLTTVRATLDTPPRSR